MAGLEGYRRLHHQLTLNQQYPQFLYAITLSYGAAVAREAANTTAMTCSASLSAPGPFVLKSWRELESRGSATEFPRRVLSDFDMARARGYKDLMGKRLPIADRVDFRIIKESQAGFLNFLAGNIDTSGLDKTSLRRPSPPSASLRRR